MTEIQAVETLAVKVEEAQVALEAAHKNLERIAKEYERACKKAEELVEQSGKGRYSRTLKYQGKSIKVEKLVYSWVVVRANKKREHYNSLREIRLGIVGGNIKI